MNILPELGRIAAAQYGLQLKDPVFAAFDKLEQDSKFNLIKTEDVDDYAAFDAVMTRYYSDITTTNILRDFLELYSIINGRMGFYAKQENPQTEDNICYWVDMLIRELMNSANGDSTYSLPTVGNGIVNGTKCRAAMYHILDILQSNSAVYGEEVTFSGSEPLYIYGRDLATVTVYGNEDGVGELIVDPMSPSTFKIKIKIKVTDILDNSVAPRTITTIFTRNKLYEGDSVSITFPRSIFSSYTVYKVEVLDFATDIDVIFNPTKPANIDYEVIRTVDFYNNTKSIEGNVNDLQVYNLMTRCNVDDSGNIVAYYGDDDYTEDGSNGQVMVYVKKFYYKMTPITLGNPDNHKLLKGSWAIADRQLDEDYKLHPAFYDAEGNEIDYFLYGAFEAVGQDSNGVYSSSYNTASYKLSSVGGNTMKPITGFSRATARTMATNRGTGWYSTAIWQHSAIQMLFGVEFGFNSQVAVGKGICNDSSMHNTGETTGNTTSGTRDNTTTAVNWRGIENLWGNVFNWNDGINFYNRTPYICDTFNFVDDTSTGYTQVVFGLPLYNWVSEFGYDENFDWLLLPIESTTTDKSNDQIGDRVFSISQNAWKICRMGGQYTVDTSDGIMCWSCDINSNNTGGDSGARLMYIPQN